MYRVEKWKNGWLWVKSHPDAAWMPASDRDAIRWLVERVTFLEAKLSSAQQNPGDQSPPECEGNQAAKHGGVS